MNGSEGLNVFMILIYPGDVDVGHLLDELRNTRNDRQNFSSQLGRTNFACAWRDHGDLFSLRQWSCNFGCDLLNEIFEIERLKKIIFQLSLTFGKVSRSISIMAASRYSL